MPWSLSSSRSFLHPAHGWSGLLPEELLHAVGRAVGHVRGELRLEQEPVAEHGHLQHLAGREITGGRAHGLRQRLDVLCAGCEVVERGDHHARALRLLDLGRGGHGLGAGRLRRLAHAGRAQLRLGEVAHLDRRGLRLGGGRGAAGGPGGGVEACDLDGFDHCRVLLEGMRTGYWRLPRVSRAWPVAFCEVAALLDMNCIFRLAAVSWTMLEGWSPPLRIAADISVICVACPSRAWPQARDIASYQLVPLPDDTLPRLVAPGPLAKLAWPMKLFSAELSMLMVLF